MKIIDIIKSKKYTISYEVFPPKTTDKFDSVIETAEAIGCFDPDFMSVTYGAGGGTGEYTAGISADLQDNTETTVLSHLTCLSSTRDFVTGMLRRYKDLGIENILALRGDVPKDGKIENDFKHASELVRMIKETDSGICVGGACYPEGHPESDSIESDISYLKEKVDCGCDFLTTQMFFENAKLYEFLELAHKAGISVPIIAGIMPITKKNQLERSVSLSGTSVPHALSELISKYGDDPSEMKKAGINYACGQIEDLINNGVNNIHIYSMNRPGTAGIINSFIKRMIKG